MRQFLGIDSLGYLSHAGMLSCMGNSGEDFCAACFSGKYPMPIPAGLSKDSLEASFAP
jgi:amidophosphoribosyltransferase